MTVYVVYSTGYYNDGRDGDEIKGDIYLDKIFISQADALAFRESFRDKDGYNSRHMSAVKVETIITYPRVLKLLIVLTLIIGMPGVGRIFGWW